MLATDAISNSRGEPPAIRTASRPRWWLVASLLVLFVSNPVENCDGQLERIEDDIRSGRQLDLEQRLRYGLRAILKTDFLFIKKVTARVDAGELPQSMVDSTFLWARRRALARRPKSSLRPMIYFRPAMIARAKVIGVLL